MNTLVLILGLLTLLGGFVPACDGVIYEYDAVSLPNLVLKYRSVYMFSHNDAPFVNEKNPGAYISFDLTFTQDEDKTGSLEDNVVEVRIVKSGAGAKATDTAAKSAFCCTPEQAKFGTVCTEPNSLVTSAPTETTSEVIRVDFSSALPTEDGKISVEKRFTYQIEEKDLYSLMFSYCQPKDALVTISGSVAWRNPFGFLPGELYGFLSFYFYLSMIYLFCALVWGYLNARHWRDLLLLQNCITAVLVLGMIEVNLRYSDFHALNETGVRSNGLLMAAVLFQVVKKAVSRMLVLVVCMGYGVVKPHLGEEGQKVMLLGAVYFVLATIHHLVDGWSRTDQETWSGAKFFFLVPVAVVDTIFYFWIFRSLQTTINMLDKRGQDIKLNLYLRFRRLIAMSIILSIVWAIYYILENFMEFNTLEWESVYFMESFWDILYLIILVAIMILWRPNQNSQRYAYHAVRNSENDIEEYDEGLEDSVGDFELKDKEAARLMPSEDIKTS